MDGWRNWPPEEENERARVREESRDDAVERTLELRDFERWVMAAAREANQAREIAPTSSSNIWYEGFSGSEAPSQSPPESTSARQDARSQKSDCSDDYVQLPQNVENSGYYNYGTPPNGAGQFGKPETVEFAEALGAAWAATGAAPIGVGNMSLRGGGNFRGHSKNGPHSTGLGIDVRPVRKDGAQVGNTTWQSPSYDRVATQALVDIAKDLGAAVIYFNDPQIKGVQKWDGHDNHLHITVNACKE